MIYVLYGALGVLLVLGLLVLGFFMGWKACGAWRAHARNAAAAEATEEERRQLLAEQKAFESMLNYNPERAYGLAPDLDELVRGDES